MVGVQFSLFILHIETYNLLSKIHLNLSIINQVKRGALCTSGHCSYVGFGEFCELMISATLSAVFCADRGGAVEAFMLTRLSAGQTISWAEVKQFDRDKAHLVCGMILVTFKHKMPLHYTCNHDLKGV